MLLLRLLRHQWTLDIEQSLNGIHKAMAIRDFPKSKVFYIALISGILSLCDSCAEGLTLQNTHLMHSNVHKSTAAQLTQTQYPFPLKICPVAIHATLFWVCSVPSAIEWSATLPAIQSRIHLHHVCIPYIRCVSHPRRPVRLMHRAGNCLHNRLTSFKYIYYVHTHKYMGAYRAGGFDSEAILAFVQTFVCMTCGLAEALFASLSMRQRLRARDTKHTKIRGLGGFANPHTYEQIRMPIAFISVLK